MNPKILEIFSAFQVPEKEIVETDVGAMFKARWNEPEHSKIKKEFLSFVKKNNLQKEELAYQKGVQSTYKYKDYDLIMGDYSGYGFIEVVKDGKIQYNNRYTVESEIRERKMYGEKIYESKSLAQKVISKINEGKSISESSYDDSLFLVTSEKGWNYLVYSKGSGEAPQPLIDDEEITRAHAIEAVTYDEAIDMLKYAVPSPINKKEFDDTLKNKSYDSYWQIAN